MVKEYEPNKEILNRIAEQKFSLSNLIELMKEYQDDETVVQYKPRMEKLYEAFSGVEISYELNDVITDEENKLTTIDSNTDIKVSLEDIKKIHNIVARIRN